MKTKCKRLLSLLLVFVLLLGLMPSVYAATDDGTQTATEPAVTEAATEPTGTADPNSPDPTEAVGEPSSQPEGESEITAMTDPTQAPAEPEEDQEKRRITTGREDR